MAASVDTSQTKPKLFSHVRARAGVRLPDGEYLWELGQIFIYIRRSGTQIEVAPNRNFDPIFIYQQLTSQICIRDTEALEILERLPNLRAGVTPELLKKIMRSKLAQITEVSRKPVTGFLKQRLYHNIPLMTHIKYHRTFSYYAGDYIVSVGSGLGYAEDVFSKFWSQLFFLVDPDPLSFRDYAPFQNLRKPVIAPDYAYVTELVAAHPEVVGNCGLFLLWPYPGLDYDFEALSLLAPRTVLWVFEIHGAAGSEAMQQGIIDLGYQREADVISISLEESLAYGVVSQQQSLELLLRWNVASAPLGLNPQSRYYTEADFDKFSSSSIPEVDSD